MHRFKNCLKARLANLDKLPSELDGPDVDEIDKMVREAGLPEVV